jgi:6-phosphogluconolactonase
LSVEVLDDPSAACAERILAVVRRGSGHIALTGGSTPGRAYELAAAADADWSTTTLWWGDDRCVEPVDSRSNYRLAKDTLLDRIAGDPPTVQRIEGELGADTAADLYDAELDVAFGSGIPSLDLVLLGLGSDGHCASLFPGKPEVEERERRVVPVPEAGLEPYVPRVSMTVPVLCAAREVIFLVSGAGKADAVAAAFGGEANPAVPASLIRPESGTLTVLLDPAAAQKLQGTG